MPPSGGRQKKKKNSLWQLLTGCASCKSGQQPPNVTIEDAPYQGADPAGKKKKTKAKKRKSQRGPPVEAPDVKPGEGTVSPVQALHPFVHPDGSQDLTPSNPVIPTAASDVYHQPDLNLNKIHVQATDIGVQTDGETLSSEKENKDPRRSSPRPGHRQRRRPPRSESDDEGSDSSEGKTSLRRRRRRKYSDIVRVERIFIERNTHTKEEVTIDNTEGAKPRRLLRRRELSSDNTTINRYDTLDDVPVNRSQQINQRLSRSKRKRPTSSSSSTDGSGSELETCGSSESDPTLRPLPSESITLATPPEVADTRRINNADVQTDGIPSDPVTENLASISTEQLIPGRQPEQYASHLIRQDEMIQMETNETFTVTLQDETQANETNVAESLRGLSPSDRPKCVDKDEVLEHKPDGKSTQGNPNRGPLAGKSNRPHQQHNEMGALKQIDTKKGAKASKSPGGSQESLNHESVYIPDSLPVEQMEVADPEGVKVERSPVMERKVFIHEGLTVHESTSAIIEEQVSPKDQTPSPMEYAEDEIPDVLSNVATQITNENLESLDIDENGKTRPTVGRRYRNVVLQSEDTKISETVEVISRPARESGGLVREIDQDETGGSFSTADAISVHDSRDGSHHVSVNGLPGSEEDKDNTDGHPQLPNTTRKGRDNVNNQNTSIDETSDITDTTLGENDISNEPTSEPSAVNKKPINTAPGMNSSEGTSLSSDNIHASESRALTMSSDDQISHGRDSQSSKFVEACTQTDYAVNPSIAQVNHVSTENMEITELSNHLAPSPMNSDSIEVPATGMDRIAHGRQDATVQQVGVAPVPNGSLTAGTFADHTSVTAKDPEGPTSSQYTTTSSIPVGRRLSPEGYATESDDENDRTVNVKYPTSKQLEEKTKQSNNAFARASDIMELKDEQRRRFDSIHVGKVTSGDMEAYTDSKKDTTQLQLSCIDTVHLEDDLKNYNTYSKDAESHENGIMGPSHAAQNNENTADKSQDPSMAKDQYVSQDDSLLKEELTNTLASLQDSNKDLAGNVQENRFTNTGGHVPGLASKATHVFIPQQVTPHCYSGGGLNSVTTARSLPKLQQLSAEVVTDIMQKGMKTNVEVSQWLLQMDKNRSEREKGHIRNSVDLIDETNANIRSDKEQDNRKSEYATTNGLSNESFDSSARVISETVDIKEAYLHGDSKDTVIIHADVLPVELPTVIWTRQDLPDSGRDGDESQAHMMQHTDSQGRLENSHPGVSVGCQADISTSPGQAASQIEQIDQIDMPDKETLEHKETLGSSDGDTETTPGVLKYNSENQTSKMLTRSRAKLGRTQISSIDIPPLELSPTTEVVEKPVAANQGSSDSVSFLTTPVDSTAQEAIATSSEKNGVASVDVSMSGTDIRQAGINGDHPEPSRVQDIASVVRENDPAQAKARSVEHSGTLEGSSVVRMNAGQVVAEVTRTSEWSTVDRRSPDGDHDAFQKVRVVVQEPDQMELTVQIPEETIQTFHDAGSYARVPVSTRMNRHEIKERRAGVSTYSGDYSSNDDSSKILLTEPRKATARRTSSTSPRRGRKGSPMRNATKKTPRRYVSSDESSDEDEEEDEDGQAGGEYHVTSMPQRRAPLGRSPGPHVDHSSMDSKRSMQANHIRDLQSPSSPSRYHWPQASNQRGSYTDLTQTPDSADSGFYGWRHSGMYGKEIPGDGMSTPSEYGSMGDDTASTDDSVLDRSDDNLLDKQLTYLNDAQIGWRSPISGSGVPLTPRMILTTDDGTEILIRSPPDGALSPAQVKSPHTSMSRKDQEALMKNIPYEKLDTMVQKVLMAYVDRCAFLESKLFDMQKDHDKVLEDNHSLYEKTETLHRKMSLMEIEIMVMRKELAYHASWRTTFTVYPRRYSSQAQRVSVHTTSMYPRI